MLSYDVGRLKFVTRHNYRFTKCEEAGAGA